MEAAPADPHLISFFVIQSFQLLQYSVIIVEARFNSKRNNLNSHPFVRFCRDAQTKGDSLTMVCTRSKTHMSLQARAVRFGRYLLRKKGLLRKHGLTVWLGHNPRPKFTRRLTYSKFQCNPTQMWFTIDPLGSKQMKGDIELCVCMDHWSVRCPHCDVDDNACIKDNNVFWKKRARLGCILWNMEESEWV